MTETVINDAVERAQQTANNIQRLRAFYSDRIVAKVNKHGGMKAASVYMDDPATIPVPTTFILDFIGTAGSGRQLTHLLLAKVTKAGLLRPGMFPRLPGRGRQLAVRRRLPQHDQPVCRPRGLGRRGTPPFQFHG